MVVIFSKMRLIRNFPENYPWYKRFIVNFIYLLTKIIMSSRKNLLNRRDLLKCRTKLRKGDILLLGNFREFSAFFLGGSVTHCALYTGNNKFIHAVAKGISYMPFHKIFTGYDSLAILRLPKNTKNRRRIIKNAIKYAKKQLGKPYNFEFKKGSGSCFSCTQLIDTAYKYAEYKTGLSLISDKFGSLFNRLLEIIKTLHPKNLLKGNFEVVFTSHNLELRKNKIFLKKRLP